MTTAAATPQNYSSLQKSLHWIIAALVLFQLFVHTGMEQAWIARMGGVAEGINPLPHILAGIAILILATWRLFIRLRRGAPPHPPRQSKALTLMATAIHFIFYALLFILPLTGLLGWFGHVEAAALAHVYIQLAFLPLIGLHVAGALAQHFYFRTNVLRRMTVSR
ncbi:hypothetical protein VW29_18210 [Devosia limi DSM 17137]|uniref:Cytochrome b561 n=1 Tax=Devosia limi DSM 17137 TaxID=1121477 RepID=A0A0F5L6P7_9HYPH|nr:cytochrome b/b6 domain-containing protein [Devosia limi]KKB77302.1 hypothetical protein VW29_18210 [Devosia limi DSM 17137]SHE65346.1 cytochrome b561 [Devosia limi DSM 17137]